MAQSAAVQVEGLPKLLKKLDAPKLTGEAQRVMLRDVGVEGTTFLTSKLSDRFPRTAASVNLNMRPESASITANRYPYVFFERGSQYPVEGTRRHRRRTGVRVSQLRIRPRRYLAATRKVIRQTLPKAVEKAAKAIEKEWSK